VRRFFLAMLLGLLTASAGAQQPLVGKPAPQFVRNDLDGRPVDLAALRGKVVLLNFWASWCGPCLVEMPRFAAWRRDLAPNLTVLSVSMDDEPETAVRVRRKLALDYPILMADAPLANDYGGILGLPVTFLIDRQGTVRSRFQGETDLSIIEARIRELIAEP
jgi:cytochrome c biogenesis protein CcmG, thiol:disulfide interchange protein DsbE